MTDKQTELSREAFEAYYQKQYDFSRYTFENGAYKHNCYLMAELTAKFEGWQACEANKQSQKMLPTDLTPYSSYEVEVFGDDISYVKAETHEQLLKAYEAVVKPQANGELVERAKQWLGIEREFIDASMNETSAPVAFHLISELLNALQANNPLLEQWQPIESAPKDGTRVLIALHNWVTEARYGEYQYRDNTYTGWHFYDSEDPWYSVGFEDYDEPTHWMLLPQPPVQLKGGICS